MVDALDTRGLHVETIDAIEVTGVGWFPKKMIAYSAESGSAELTMFLLVSIEDFEYRTPTADELAFVTSGSYQLHGPVVVPSGHMASMTGGASISPAVLEELEAAVRNRSVFGAAQLGAEIRGFS